MLLKSSTFAHLMNLFELTNYIFTGKCVKWICARLYSYSIIILFFLS